MKIPIKIDRRLVLLAPAAASILLVRFVIKETDPLAPITVSKKYVDEDGAALELLGSCKASPDSIDCWDADGNPDADLGETIRAYYIIQGGQELNFKFGRKNRLVAFKRPGYGFQGFTVGGPESPDTRFVRPCGTQQLSWQSGDPVMNWYSIDTDPKAKSTSFTFDVSKSFGNATIDLKTGAETRIGALHLRIDGIKPGTSADHQPGPFPDKNPLWVVSTTLSGIDSPRIPTLQGRAFDKQGGVVTAVDEKGDPTVQQGFGGPFGPQPKKRTFDANVNAEFGGGTLHQKLLLPVNPAKVASLQLSLIGNRKVTVTDIPLDPK